MSSQYFFRVGRTEGYLIGLLRKKGYAHLTLFDPEVRDPESLKELARLSDEIGTDGYMIGGSTVYSREMMDEAIKAVKSVSKLPVIIFPNNVTSVSPLADAIFYMSLLNSLEWWFILGAQIHGSFTVKTYGLEAIPMGYIVFRGDTSVAAVGRAFPLPQDKPAIVASYALAAQFMGMRLVYLEAGSGADSSITPSLLSAVRKAVDIPIIVGGGIRSRETAYALVQSGADIIVTGTLVEQSPEMLSDVIRGAREGAAHRRAACERYLEHPG
jgi:phosphoglycerol geranylgeranyltransferase